MSGEHDTEDEDHWDMSDDEEGDDMFASANTLDGKSWLEARGKGSGISQTILTPAVTATTNHFQAVSSSIRSHNGSAGSAELNRFHDFTHKLHIGKTVFQPQQKQESKDSVNALMAEAKKGNVEYRVIRSENDLDKPENRDIISALPRSTQSLAKLARECPVAEEVLGPNEIWS